MAHGHRPPHQVPLVQRTVTWLVWWAVLLAFWIVLDWSVAPDELLAGAAAAAIGAFLAELAGHQAAIRLRVRAAWLLPAVRLPAEVARDTMIVFAALWRRLARGEEPSSGFRELPARYGGDTAAAVTRRALLVGGRSLAPNSFVVGIDAGRDVMLVHQLVVNQGEAAE